jgi:hypothetical protein
MRRNAIRLALAVVASSFLAACADIPTGPKGPAVRFDGTLPSATPADSIARSGQQGTQV